jgi:hypothetical protein
MTNKFSFLIILFLFQCGYAQTKDSLFSIYKSKNQISFFIEHDPLVLNTLFLLSNNQNPPYNRYNELYLLGGIGVLFDQHKTVKKSIFLNYQYYQNTPQNTVLPRYVFLIGKRFNTQKYEELHFILGVDFRFTKKAKLSGFCFAIGLGGGDYTYKIDGDLYVSKKSWCNTVDLGYVFSFKHFYIKPTVGVLTSFNFKEFIDYNDGRVIGEYELNYYSQKNPQKSEVYKSSLTPGPGQIEIKYRYLGLTNTTFLPRGLLCVGFAF